MEEINRSGGNSGACHGQMYNAGTLLRHGSSSTSNATCPRSPAASSPAVDGRHQPSTGTDYEDQTTAVRNGDRYVVNGQKVWISHPAPDLMILLARTTPLAEVAKKAKGCRFIVDLHHAMKAAVRPIANMVNHGNNELFFENLEIPART
jgi:acyl-CoA dehydrogenase